MSRKMDIFQSRFYSVTVSNMALVGMWPYTKSSFVRNCKLAWCFISLFSISVAVGVKMIELWGDFDQTIDCMTLFGVQLGCYYKMFTYIAHQRTMKALMEAIKSDWMSLRDKKEIDIASRYAQDGRQLAILYTVYLYITGLVISSSPLWPPVLDLIIPLNESRPPAPPIVPAEYFVGPDQYHIPILLHTWWTVAVVLAVIIAVDTMFVCMVLHACGIIAVIGYRLENFVSKDTKADLHMSKDEDLKCTQEIKICIAMHYKITSTIEMIEATYSLGFLCILGTSVIMMSTTAVQMMTRMDTTFAEVFRIFSLNFGQVNHLFYNTWPCQKLSDECIKLEKSLYNTQWYSLSEKNKRLLRFIMLRAMDPPVLTAGKLYAMSMENFGAVIKTTVTYFTVFASLR